MTDIQWDFKAAIARNEGLAAMFNRRTGQSLALLVQDMSDVAQKEWEKILGESLVQKSPEKKFQSISSHITFLFDEEWPQPTAPQKPKDGSDRDRIIYERDVDTYKKRQRLYERQRPGAISWFIEEVLKAWPGRKDETDNEDIKNSLPNPILPEDYPRYVASLKWFLTERVEGQAHLNTVQDLRMKTLASIQFAYDEIFTTEITDLHLLACDQKFLSSLIPDNTPDDERHPDADNVKFHAEIIAEGSCHDGMGWKLRRLNSQTAAMEYGNPSGRVNGSNLCFTWGGDRDNIFHEYKHDLLMLIRNDGTDAIFVHVHSEMYNNILDQNVGMDYMFESYPGSAEAIAPLLLDKFNFHFNRNEYSDCELVMASTNEIEVWDREFQKIPAQSLISILDYCLHNKEWRIFNEMLETLARSSAKKEALPFIRIMMQMCVDCKLPRENFLDVFLLACLSDPKEFFESVHEATVKNFFRERFDINNPRSLKRYLIDPFVKANSDLPPYLKSLVIEEVVGYFNVVQHRQHMNALFSGGLKAIEGQTEFESAVHKIYSHFKPEAQELIKEYIGVPETQKTIAKTAFDNGPNYN